MKKAKTRSSSRRARNVREAATASVLSDEPVPADAAMPNAPSTQPLARSSPMSIRAMLVVIVAASLVTAILYGFTLNFPFQFDGATYILGNPVVKDITAFGSWANFQEVVGASRRLGLDPDVSLNFVLRPVSYLTFHLNYLFDEFNPWSYRLVNILLHTANAVLLFHLLNRLLQAARPATSSVWWQKYFIPGTAALLFLVHPLQTESVTYIVQRFTSLVCFFILVGMVCAFEAFASTNKRTAILLHTTGVISVFLGMMSKESACMAPILIVAAQILFFRVSVWKSIRNSLPYLLLLPVVPSIVMAVANVKDGGDANLDHALNVVNPVQHPVYPLYYALTQPGVILSYLKLLVLPVGQTVDPDIKPVTSFVNPTFVLPLALLVTWVVAAWKAYRKAPTDYRRSLILFGTLWFFVTVLPSSSLVPLPDFMAEHRCYDGSIGFFIAVATLLSWLSEKLAAAKPYRLTIPSATAIIAVILGATTIHRNEVWRSPESLWDDAIKHGPGKARPYGNRGVSHFEAGEIDEAIECFKKSIELDPEYGWGYLNLGRLYNIRKQYPEGLKVSEAGLRIAPNDVELCYNMGVACAGIGRLKDSEKWFEKALKTSPQHAASHRALGQVFAALKEFEKSLNHLQTANTLIPNDPDTMNCISSVRAAIAQTP